MADLYADQESIQRRRQLLAAMQGQNLGGKIEGNGKQALVQALSKLGTAYVLKNGGSKLDQENSDNQTAQQAQLGAELENYMNTRQGRPGETMSDAQVQNLMQNDQAPQLAEPVQADPRKAVLQAMTSRDPRMQAVGAAGLQELGKGPAKPEVMNVNGKLVRIGPDGMPTQVGDYSDPKPKWGNVEQFGAVAGKPLMGQRDQTSGKVDWAPTGGVNVGVDVNMPGEKKGVEKFQEKQIESLMPGGEDFAAAKGSAEAVRANQESLGSINAGGQTGFAGEAVQVLRKMGTMVGIGDAATTTNTDALGAQLGQRVLAKLGGKLGGQISDGDREFLSKVSGNLTTDPAALKRLIAIDTFASLEAINKFNDRIGSTVQRNPGYADLQNYTVPINADFGQDPEFAAMMANLLKGKASNAGMATAPGAPSAPQQPVPGGPSRPPLTWKNLDPRVKM